MEIPFARSRFATPALVAGLLVLVPIVGLLTFIPAIVLGILTLRDKPKTGRASGWAGVVLGSCALVVGGIALLLGILSPFMNAASEPGAYSLQNGKTLMKVIDAAATESVASGGEFFPADTKAADSQRFFTSLVKLGFLSASELKKLHPELLQVTNVAFDDPPDTLVFVTKEGVPGKIIVGIKSGEVRAFDTAQSAGEFAKVPPRKPAFLP